MSFSPPLGIKTEENSIVQSVRGANAFSEAFGDKQELLSDLVWQQQQHGGGGGADGGGWISWQGQTE